MDVVIAVTPGVLFVQSGKEVGNLGFSEDIHEESGRGL